MDVVVEESVVRRLFPQAVSLHNFLHSYLNIALPDDGSNPTASMVSSLCKTIIVVPSKGIIPIELRLLSSCAMQTSNESTSVQEVLSNLVSMDVRGTQSRRDQDRNILSLGYRLKRWQSEAGMICSNDIECFYVNTIHTIFMSSAWRQLLKLIGDGHLLTLLSQCMFQPIARGCYMQISGVSVSRLIYSDQEPNASLQKQVNRPEKKFEPGCVLIEKPALGCNVADSPLQSMPYRGGTIIPRSRIFYHRKRMLITPAPNSGCVNEYVGLPSNHILRKESVLQLGRGLKLLADAGSVCSPLPHDLQLELDRLLDRLRLQYYACDFLKSLNFHCPLVKKNDSALSRSGAACSNGTVEIEKALPRVAHSSIIQYDKAEPSAPIESTSDSCFDNKTCVDTNISGCKRKKTRRGSRGGAHVKQRKLISDVVDHALSNPHSDIPNVEALSSLLDIIYSDNCRNLTSADNVTNHMEIPVELDPNFGINQTGARKRKAAETPRCSTKSKIRRVSAKQRPPCMPSQGVQLKRLVNGAARSKPISSNSTLATVGHKLLKRLISCARIGSRFYFDKQVRLMNSDDNAAEDIYCFSTQLDESPICSDVEMMTNNPLSTTNSEFATPELIPHDCASNLLSGRDYICIAERRLLTQLSTQTSENCAASMSSGRAKPAESEGPKNDSNIDRLNSSMSIQTPPCSDENFSKNPQPDLTNFSSVFSDGKVNFQELAINHTAVSSFLKTTCRRLFPREVVWGSRKNLSVFLSGLDRYVHLGRQETVTLEHLCSRIKLSALPWLTYPPPSTNKDHRPLYNSILHSFMFWIYTEVVNPLLRSCFYATEGEGCGNETLFYRHHIWGLLCKIGEAQIKKNFVELNLTRSGILQASTGLGDAWDNNKSIAAGTQVLVQPNQLGYVPSVRLVPKKWAMRPITNLRSIFLRAKGHGAVKNSSIAKVGFTCGINNKLFKPKLMDTTAETKTASHLSNTSIIPPPFLVTNATLYNILHVLRDMVNKSPELNGFGVSGTDEIYCRFKSYKQNLMLKCERENYINGYLDMSRNQFYLATLDLDKCFDNMDTAKLFALVEKVVDGHFNSRVGNVSHGGAVELNDDEDEESNHLIHKYSVAHFIPSLDKKVLKTIKVVTKGNDLIPFKEAADNLCKTNRDCIITDGVLYPSISNRKLLSLLNTHLFGHVVRLPSLSENLVESENSYKTSSRSAEKFSYFTQIKGIPQGSVLSPILCNIYYGNAENKEFGGSNERKLLGLDSNESVIVRMMDDYIMISTNREAVGYFLQQMHNVMKAYGGGINPIKTRVNFDAEIFVDGEIHRLTKIPNDESITWCGWCINTKSLDVSPSFERLLERPISSSVVVSAHNGGLLLCQVMKSYLRPKCHAIVLDPFLNSRRNILRSICKIFFVAAMRSFSYMSGIRFRLDSTHHSGYLYRCITEAVLYGSSLIRGRMAKAQDGGLATARLRKHSSEMKEEEGITEMAGVRNLQVLLIGYSSFLRIFKKKSSRLGYVLKLVEQKIQKSLRPAIPPCVCEEIDVIIDETCSAMLTSQL